MQVIDRLLASLHLDGIVVDVRIGALWTAVVVETARGLRAGLASTQLAHDLAHGQPAVREAGGLLGKPARELAALARPLPAGSPAPTLTERALGLATVNALLEVDPAVCSERNAEDVLLERAPGRRVAIVGHFPFVPRVRAVAAECWVLELAPRADDIPAERAPELLPRADVVAITGQTLVNGTFEGLAALCRRDAFVLVLGPTTPLSPVLFDYGVSLIAGSQLTDIPLALDAVSQGANFRQIPGKKLVTMVRT